jgi:hypothetical protein
VRNPQFGRSPTEHCLVRVHAICGFLTGCGLIIRRLKKNGPKKGPGKGPTPQSDSIRCPIAARNLLQRNNSRVGRRGLEPRTYGLKGWRGPLDLRGQSLSTKEFLLSEAHPEPPRTTWKGLPKGLHSGYPMLSIAASPRLLGLLRQCLPSQGRHHHAPRTSDRLGLVPQLSMWQLRTWSGTVATAGDHLASPCLPPHRLACRPLTAPEMWFRVTQGREAGWRLALQASRRASQPVAPISA